MMNFTIETIEKFKSFLEEEEKCEATVDKYLRDVRAFKAWIGDGELCKSAAVEYKAALCERYAPASVNAAIASLNSFFAFMGRYDMKLKSLKVQKQIFASMERELSKIEYMRLLETAKRRGNERLYMLMQTICSSGVRVSEVRFITIDAVKRGYADIVCKGKRRRVILPAQLCGMLKRFASARNIKSGPVFVTKNGKPLDRSNIWSDMKRLCAEAKVDTRKVFPHNLRHLFARTYYSIQKDVVRLADILGHSNVNTTRIYTMENGETHIKQIQKLGLLLC